MSATQFQDLRLSAPVMAWDGTIDAFRRVQVAAGASADVAFTLSRADLQFIGADLQPRAEAGVFDVWRGPSSAHGLHAQVTLAPP